MARRGQDSGFDDDDLPGPEFRGNPLPAVPEDDNLANNGDDDELGLGLFPAVPNQQPPAAAAGPAPGWHPPLLQPRRMAQGGQLASLATYDGKTDIDVWVEQVDHAQRAFDWTSPVTADAAKTKLIGEAAVWIAGQRKMTNNYPNWNDGAEDTQLRKALKDRFKPKITALEAADAIKGLQQKGDESVSAFFDRCIWAADVKNSLQFDEEERRAQAYVPIRDNDITMFFVNGMKEDIRELVVGGGESPDNVNDLIARARQVEAAMRKKAASVHEVKAEAGSHEKQADKPKDESLNVADLKKEISMLRSQVKCFNCDRFGHMKRECPMKGKGRGQRKGGQGRGRGQNNRGGQGQSNSGGGGGGRGQGAPGGGRGAGIFIPMANLGQFGFGNYLNQGQPQQPSQQSQRPIFTVTQNYEDAPASEDYQYSGNE